MLIDIFNLSFTKEVKGILHLGAHECEERLAYLSKFNNITDNDIIWIDALENKVNSIRQKYPSIKIFNECISDTDNKTVSFTITNNYQSSSILKLKDHLIEHPDIYEIDKIEMKTKTLKTFYNENNFNYDQFNFINLDIQGTELLSLIGAGDILNTIDYIYIEVNTKELYENCALLDDIDSYLGKFNFVRKNILMTEHGWGDAFYVKEFFHISNNIKIQYGTDLIKIDITEQVLNTNVNNKNIIYIPYGDEDRAKMYGDPVYGQLKYIYIESDTDSYIIDHTDKIYIDKNKNTLSFNLIKNNTINYELCVMAIFKNESLNLKIWIEHYLWQGVDHFYLIDNDSTDNPLEILQYYIDKGIVSYFYRPEKYKQAEHYRNIFDENNLKEKTNWLIICDIDEFFFGTEKKLISTLTDYDNYDVINTNSFFYGPDDNIEHPRDIRVSNVYRNSDTINGNKYIFKPRIIKDSSEIWIHWLVIPNTLQKQTFENEIYENTKIRLNHYQIQSVYFYEKIKMTRGDVSRVENEHIRTKEAFENYKKECIIKDDILKNIIQNNIYDRNEEIKFYDENNNLIDNKSIEYIEQQLVKQYILEDDVVLELGARYGTVSCSINKKLNDKHNQISVEPDQRVWDALELNKIRNNCNFNVVKGFISNKKLDLTNLGEGLSAYGSTFIENNDTKIPSYSLYEIRQKYNINNFTVLVADCEGFLETFLDENQSLYEELRLIIFESDYVDKCNYHKIKENLLKYKFINKLEGHQNVWIKIN